MDIIEKAVIFAAKAHKNQLRKGTDIPYVTHPFSVGMLLQKADCSDEVIAAGILHDTLEDTETTYKDLTEAFGVRVANLVQTASENDKTLPWEVRKQQTIEKLKATSLEEMQVIVADKFHNLKSIRTDLNQNGDVIWQRFNRGKREQQWYYSSIVKALSSRKREFKLIRALEVEVKGVFGSIDFLSEQEISMLFSCAYHHIDETVEKKLESKELLRFAQTLVKEADHIYHHQHNVVIEKLDDLHSRGIEFEMNSEGPIILASYCIALQNKMQWSDEELFKHFKKNIAKL